MLFVCMCVNHSNVACYLTMVGTSIIVIAVSLQGKVGKSRAWSEERKKVNKSYD